MSKEKIIAAYEKLAAPYDALIDHKPHNAYYDRPNTLGLLGDVKGMNILDAACGPGKYAEILLDKGARVTGVDISPSMISLAKKRNKAHGSFFVHDLADPFEQFPDENFDGILCALAFHYLEDWNPTLREFNRMLKPGGELVMSIEHPFFEYQYFDSKAYFETELVSAIWGGFGKPVEVPSYRRSLQSCISPILRNGFLLMDILEPRPTKEFEALDPKHFKELNEFPSFLCLKAYKA